MSWVYEVSTGRLYNDDGTLVGKGYSGHPPYVNDVAAQNIADYGPIPIGKWTITGVEENNPKLGPFVLVLCPDAQTRVQIAAMGRQPDSFRIHGERLEPPAGYASDGCMIQERDVREEVWASSDHDLETVAEIDPTGD